MGKNSKGGQASRRSFHEADLQREREQEAARQAKLAKKQQKRAEEEQADAISAAAGAAAPGSGMEVEPRRPLSKKQRIGVVKKGPTGIRKPPRMMRKTLKKLEKKRSMDLA
jgi:hypothetical protein